MAYVAAAAAIASGAKKVVGWLVEKFGGCSPKGKDYWFPMGRADMEAILFDRPGPGDGKQYCSGSKEGSYWLEGTRSLLADIGAPLPPNFHNPPPPLTALNVTWGKLIVTGNAGMGSAGNQALGMTLKATTGVDYKSDPTNPKLKPYIDAWVDFNKSYEVWKEDARGRFEAWKAGKAPPPAKSAAKPEWFGPPAASWAVENATKAVAKGLAGVSSLGPYARISPGVAKAAAQAFPVLATLPGMDAIPALSEMVSDLTGAVGDALGDVGDALGEAFDEALDDVTDAAGEWLEDVF